VRSERWYARLCCESFGGPGERGRVDHPAELVAEHETEFFPGGPGKEPFGVLAASVLLEHGHRGGVEGDGTP
jgi:hypothetical protein